MKTHSMVWSCIVFFACLLGGSLVGCGKDNADHTGPDTSAEHGNTPVTSKVQDMPLESEYAGLHNVIAFGPVLVNGSAPETDAAFDSLKAIGIKTIISVEAGTPDVERARARGMRYVHLPIGYDKVPLDQGMLIVKAVRDLDTPIYLHCYHGVHRSPAASAYAMVASGQMDQKEALHRMEAAGVSHKYVGLYKSVGGAPLLSPDMLDALPAEFPEIAKTDSLEATMSKVGRHWDFMKLLQANTWKPVAENPDLTAARESEILADFFEDVSRNESVRQGRSKEFLSLLDTAVTAAVTMKEIFNSNKDGDAELQYELLKSSCKTCHDNFRN